MLIAYENVGTDKASETYYYYGAEGLSCQNNDTTGQYFAYHYDNIGSTTLITDKNGRIIEKFAYGTYGELLTEVVNNIRFLYNGSFGVVTDSNGLYYMRACYYNPDIKRFINQDIKVGDISNGQGLNRYAYCEGNPVSMVDPFGLCGENANEQGDASKYQWLHNALDIAGLAFDAADVINAGVYALEGKWGQAAVSLACALPAIGTAIAGVSKATKFAKVGNIIGQTMKYAGKAYMTVQTASESLKLAGDAKAEYAVNGGKLTWSVAKKAVGALALGALATMSASSLMKDVTSLTKMSDLKTKTTVADVADSVSGKVEKSSGISGENISAGSGGMMKNRNRGSVVWTFGTSRSKSILNYVPSSGATLKATTGKTTTILGTYKNDTCAILKELGSKKSLDFGPRDGSFNLLNTPDELYKTPDQFWNDYNKPWLDNVISRDDNIILATQPTWYNLTRINNVTGKYELTGFGREYWYLKKNGYKFNNVTKMMER